MFQINEEKNCIMIQGNYTVHNGYTNNDNSLGNIFCPIKGLSVRRVVFLTLQYKMTEYKLILVVLKAID